MRVTIFVPTLSGKGGVAHYYRSLRLEELEYIQIRVVNSTSKKLIVRTRNLISNCVFCLKLDPSQNSVVLNPSFDFKALVRDGVLAWLLSLRGIRFVVFYRGWADTDEEVIKKQNALLWLLRQTLFKASKSLVLGEIFKNKLIELGYAKPIVKVTTVTAGNESVSEESIAQKWEERPPTNFLIMSRMDEAKGVLESIEALKSVQANFECHICGGGPLEDQVKQICTMDERFQFHGFVQGEAKELLLKSSHFLLFPTRHGEGLPNAILEAMYHGIIPICTLKGGMSDWLSAQNALILEGTSATAIQHGLASIEERRHKWKDLAIENHLTALNNFTKDVVKSRLLATLDVG